MLLDSCNDLKLGKQNYDATLKFILLISEYFKCLGRFSENTNFSIDFVKNSLDVLLLIPNNSIPLITLCCILAFLTSVASLT